MTAYIVSEEGYMNKSVFRYYPRICLTFSKPQRLADANYESQKFKHFIESEKNILDYMKTFVTISFMLNSGGIALILTYKNELFPVVLYLVVGSIVSIFMYFLAAIAVIVSAIYSSDFGIFFRARVASYICMALGIFSSVVSFYYATIFGVKIIEQASKVMGA